MRSNTAVTEDSAEKRKADPFTITDGRYVGDDGFVVPKDFDEFYQRFPQHGRNWMGRHVDRSTTKQDVEDWTQDLLIHLNGKVQSYCQRWTRLLRPRRRVVPLSG